MVSVANKPFKELPQLSAQKSVGIVRENRYPVRNKLAEQNNKPMNQTYTLGQRPLAAATTAIKQRERSCSIDSDIAEYTIQGAIAGLFPRAYNKSIGTLSAASQHSSRASSFNGNASFKSKNDCSLQRVFSNKLPSLDGCSPERKCCQRPFGRAQAELQKYKEAIKNTS